MIILIFFAFLGGIVTILSPCILPILPIVLSGSVTGGKKRPLGVVTGFILSFTFFTLFLSSIVRATGLSADSLRIVAVVVISLFGLSLIMPALQKQMEMLFTKLSSFGPKANSDDGFVAGIFVGLSLGLVWTPCVGPILASIITLAATSSVGLDAVILTLTYATGTAIPLLAITYSGRNLLTRHPWLVKNTQAIQRAFGVLMIITAVAILFSWDRKFQTYVLEKFPAYGTGLTSIEDNEIVINQLEDMKGNPKSSMLNSLLESDYGKAPEFIPGGEWLNSEPLTMQSLRDNVVLVDFWTYTCINCIRTLPYLRTWHKKYADDGLVIVGVHTPEFEFEKDLGNVQKAVEDFELKYPIMQDNNYATWRAYNNRYWPAKYLIDKDGTIRYTHFGEGEYNETEQWIQKLLKETGKIVDESIDNPTYQVESRTPETYLGTARGDYSRITTTGKFSQTTEYTNPQKGASLAYRFNASEVFLVMRPITPGTTATVRITLDGKEIGTFAGDDVVDGTVTVDTDRLYKLIKLPTPGQHTLQLEFLDDNATLFAFTFG